ncbi:unnamed protein product [Ilex paraguariensis]|uniref:Pentatricopeptide repeat-containing protein n=1 Tax=Ilex paraguariensis TaxID=185542 RepID=A0ABC8UHU5_9AQUA
MEALGIGSRNVADSAMFRGLVQCGKMEEAMLILDCMLRVQLVPTITTFTTLMHKFCKEFNPIEATLLLTNVLITGLCASGGIVQAFDLYEEIKQRDLCPNTTTFTVLTDALLTKNNIVKGEMILMDLQDRGLISRDQSTQDLHKGLMDHCGGLLANEVVMGISLPNQLGCKMSYLFLMHGIMDRARLFMDRWGADFRLSAAKVGKSSDTKYIKIYGFPTDFHWCQYKS